jgi:hypothetical protein
MTHLTALTRWIAYGLLSLGLVGVARLAQELMAPDPHRSVVTQLGSFPIMDEAWLDDVSGYDIIFLTPGAWEGRETEQKELVMRNPDVEFGTYFSLHTCPVWMADAADSTYPGRLWAYLSKHLAVDAAGDTAMIWNGARYQPVYDLFEPGVMEGAAGILAGYCRAAGITAVFLDYASSPIACSGDSRMDLDRNGVDQCADLDEQAVLAAAWRQYMDALHAALPGVRLVVNGSLAVKDASFWDHLADRDGVFFESWPAYYWTDFDAAAAALPALLERGPNIYLENVNHDPRTTALTDSLGCVEAVRMKKDGG